MIGKMKVFELSADRVLIPDPFFSPMINHLLPENGLLRLAQLIIASGEEVPDNLFLTFYPEISDLLEAFSH